MDGKLIADFSSFERLHSPKLRIIVGVQGSSVFFKTSFELYMIEERRTHLDKKYTKLAEEHDFFDIIERI